MAVVQALIYNVLAIVLLAGALLAVLRVGWLSLDTMEGRRRDGPAIGSRLSLVDLVDVQGKPVRESPGEWSFLVFSDHSLEGFPDLIRELQRFACHPDRAVVLLSKAPHTVNLDLASRLGSNIRVATVSRAYFASRMVRTMPLGVVIDDAGVVRAKSLVGASGSVDHLWAYHARPGADLT